VFMCAFISANVVVNADITTVCVLICLVLVLSWTNIALPCLVLSCFSFPRLAHPVLGLVRLDLL
jgi:hypothetical protein